MLLAALSPRGAPLLLEASSYGHAGSCRQLRQGRKQHLKVRRDAVLVCVPGLLK